MDLIFYFSISLPLVSGLVEPFKSIERIIFLLLSLVNQVCWVDLIDWWWSLRIKEFLLILCSSYQVHTVNINCSGLLLRNKYLFLFESFAIRIPFDFVSCLSGFHPSNNILRVFFFTRFGISYCKSSFFLFINFVRLSLSHCF